MTPLESLQRSNSNPMQCPQYFLNPMVVANSQHTTPSQRPALDKRKQKAVSTSYKSLMIEHSLLIAMFYIIQTVHEALQTSVESSASTTLCALPHLCMFQCHLHLMKYQWRLMITNRTMVKHELNIATDTNSCFCAVQKP